MGVLELVGYSLWMFVAGTIWALSATRFWCYLEWDYKGSTPFDQDGPPEVIFFKLLTTEVVMTGLALNMTWSLFTWPSLIIVLVLKLAMYRFLSRMCENL